MTFVRYFGYQNSRAIHTEKSNLPVLLFLQQNKTVYNYDKHLSSVKEGLQSHWTQDTERQTRVTFDTRHRKIDTGNIGHKTQKDKHGQHWAQDTEKQTHVALNTRHRKIDMGNIGHKTQKERHG